MGRGILDDYLAYCYSPEKYMLVVNASNIEKDWNWLKSQNDMGAELENASDRISQLAVQGPQGKGDLAETDFREPLWAEILYLHHRQHGRGKGCHNFRHRVHGGRRF